MENLFIGNRWISFLLIKAIKFWLHSRIVVPSILLAHSPRLTTPNAHTLNEMFNFPYKCRHCLQRPIEYLGSIEIDFTWLSICPCPRSNSIRALCMYLPYIIFQTSLDFVFSRGSHRMCVNNWNIIYLIQKKQNLHSHTGNTYRQWLSGDLIVDICDEIVILESFKQYFKL